jgi:hypothetical protein
MGSIAGGFNSGCEKMSLRENPIVQGLHNAVLKKQENVDQVAIAEQQGSSKEAGCMEKQSLLLQA